MEGQVFKRRDGSLVKLSTEALLVLESYRQYNPLDLEAGGILLGRYINNSPDVVVDEVTGPLPGDERTLCTFYRDAKAHQDVINERWHSSGGTCNYLGEWHTHAEPAPTPSVIDFTDWKQRLEKDFVDAPFVLFVIVGTERILVCEGDRNSKEIRPLEFVAQ